jgi:saccharopine dehydrogenase-like NADP-dependent oxidoreductase
MKILLLGVGMQGKAVLQDLVSSNAVTRIIAADIDMEMLYDRIEAIGIGEKVKCVSLDATDSASINTLFAEHPDVVIDTLPPSFHNAVTLAAVEHNCHLVNASYATPEMEEISAEAERRGLAILPELGLDPGIDLVVLGNAVELLDEVHAIKSYGAGVPELCAADNPLKYKVTWTLEGVLKAYRRTAYLIRDGQVVKINDTDIFNPENMHPLHIDGLGETQAYHNGDAAKYVELLGLDPANIKIAGRYAMRWPGHCALIKAMVDLHLLDPEPVMINGAAIDRRQFLAAAIEPHILLGEKERDITIVRVEVGGVKDGRERRLVYQMIDYRDLSTGLSAMSRTVGYPASIGAHMICDGTITNRGLLSPVRDIPYAPFIEELKKRNIIVTREISDYPDCVVAGENTDCARSNV